MIDHIWIEDLLPNQNIIEKLKENTKNKNPLKVTQTGGISGESGRMREK